MTTQPLETWPNVCIEVKTPDGTMFVNVLEDENGAPIKVQIIIGKAGTSVAAWAQGTSNLVSSLLEKGEGINHIISLLSNQTSSKEIRSANGTTVRSAMEGVVSALIDYRRMKFNELKDLFEGDYPRVAD